MSALGVLSGFNPTKIATTAATTVRVGPCYVAARLTAGAAAAKMRIFNTAAGTAAGSLVSILAASVAQSADETGVPIRCDVGCTVLMSVNTATGFVYIR